MSPGLTARPALAREPDGLPVFDAGRDLHGEVLAVDDDGRLATEGRERQIDLDARAHVAAALGGTGLGLGGRRRRPSRNRSENVVVEAAASGALGGVEEVVEVVDLDACGSAAARGPRAAACAREATGESSREPAGKAAREAASTAARGERVLAERVVLGRASCRRRASRRPRRPP